MISEELVAVPNVSEGRDADCVARLGNAFAPARLLDTHRDADHGRSVFTVAARQGALSDGLVKGARAALEAIDLAGHEGRHPHVGSLDVMPVVYRELSLIHI